MDGDGGRGNVCMVCMDVWYGCMYGCEDGCMYYTMP